MFLYHATDKKNLDSILEKGLLTNSGQNNWNDMYCEGKIFLAFNPSVAEDYADCSDNPPEETVILKIKFEALNQSAFEYDWNNRCEYSSDINSVVYLQDIPPNAIIGACKDDDSDQSLEDFKNTEMYDIIFDTFWEECETNLEREDEEW